ncbi:hypothetical protein AWC01_10275 [Mycobacterium doricum]|uniref:Uncharacterized protein n=1 Tax=Mycolicibacterium doricum TaxID=126673 RepID=A0A1X1T8K0_9MYCO|nr:hypothetical protein AWC01_10275 [Mycolicibacterium doricum]
MVIVVRFLWMFPVATIDERLHRRKQHVAEPIGWREMTISSWAGMRGVVTLAAVLALPPEFPEREGADPEVIERARQRRTNVAFGRTRPARRPIPRRAHRPCDDGQRTKEEILTVAREAVVRARSESGTDPTVVDRVLRRLDARGSQPE